MKKRSKFKQTEIGKIPEDWEVKIIRDLVKINQDTINKNYNELNIEYIDTSSVDKGHLVETQKIKLEEAPSRAKRIIKDNDILISTVRPNLKHFFFVKKSKKNLIGSTGFAVISAKKINPEFLYYYLTTENYTDFLTSIADAHTSTYPSFNPDVIETSFCPFPKENEQIAIAQILSDLDFKIELNQQMNKILEAIGQAIFKRWFVDFEFPNEKGKPYKSSGGVMVDSELGNIPKGWKVGTFSDIINLLMGLSPKGESYNETYKGTPLLNGAGDFEKDIICPNKYTSEPTRLCKKGDLLFCIRGTIGNITFADKEYCLGRGVASITPKNNLFMEYAYFILTTKLGYFISKASGSVIKGLSKPDILDVQIIIPDTELINMFHDLSQKLILKKESNKFQNNYLESIRDSLLPRLMSGKIRVPVEVIRK